MRWVEHVVRMRESRGVYKVFVGGGNLKEIDPDVDGRIILKYIAK